MFKIQISKIYLMSMRTRLLFFGFVPDALNYFITQIKNRKYRHYA